MRKDRNPRAEPGGDVAGDPVQVQRQGAISKIARFERRDVPRAEKLRPTRGQSERLDQTGDVPLIRMQAAPKVPVEAVVAQGGAEAKNGAEDNSVRPPDEPQGAGKRGRRALERSVQ